MPRESYQNRLSDLRAEVAAMAEMTLDRYQSAVAVLESGDAREARRIIEGDGEINEWYLDIESDCIELIALQQPVASDLRFVASTFKIVTDIERIGDLATNLAAYGRDSGGTLSEYIDVVPVATDAGDMVADAVAAYRTEDPGAARAVASRDDELDARCKHASETIVRELVTTGAGGVTDLDSHTERISRALLTIRDLERVGDHAVNISARTLYMIEQDDELIY